MSKLTTLKIRRPCDFHTHLRSPAQVGDYLFGLIVQMNTNGYEYVIIEPNTFLEKGNEKHHIENAGDVVKYRGLVKGAVSENNKCKMLFLIKLTPRTTPQIIRDAADVGCIGLKLYPEGVTTGSDVGGISDFFSEQMVACLEEMAKRNMILQIHPELPKVFCLEKEFLFHQVLRRYVTQFPTLKIFVEHVTDRRTLDLIRELRQRNHNVFGTITGHHPYLTTDDVLGQVDHHCLPCAKYPEDMRALIKAATNPEHYFLSITDSAPHTWENKHEVMKACGGVFNPAHIAIPLMVQRFEESNALSLLGNFNPINGLAAYGLESDNETITLVKEQWKVPLFYGEGKNKVTPFRAGMTLEWQIKNS